MIDAADPARFEESRQGAHPLRRMFPSDRYVLRIMLLFAGAALVALLKQMEKLRELPILVLANKADMPNAETAEHVGAALRIDGAITSHVQLCSAHTGQGVQAGLSWLCTKLE